MHRLRFPVQRTAGVGKPCPVPMPIIQVVCLPFRGVKLYEDVCGIISSIFEQGQGRFDMIFLRTFQAVVYLRFPYIRSQVPHNRHKAKR